MKDTIVCLSPVGHVLLSLSLLGATAVAGEPLFPARQMERIQQGVRAIYNLEHDRAVEIYQAMIDESPDDPAGYTYLAKTYWLQELVSKQELSIDRFAASDFFAETVKYKPKVDPTVEQRFRQANDLAIAKGRERLKTQPNDRTTLFLLGQAYQNLASFEASLKRSWWASFRAGSKTFRYHSELLRRDPSFYDAYLSTGVFHYVVGRLGWNVKWLAFMLGYRGSREEGKRELRICTEKAQLVADDARVILTLIHTREKNLQATFDEMSVLLKRYPKNYLVHLDMGGIAMLMDRTDVAVTVYRDILRKMQDSEDSYDRLEPAIVHNRLGVTFRVREEFEHSAWWFRKSLEDASTSTLSRVVAHLEMGKTYDRMGSRQQALHHYESVLELEDFADSRREARQLLKRSHRRD